MKFLIILMFYPPVGQQGNVTVIQGFESIFACEVAQNEFRKVAPTSVTKCVNLPLNNKAARSIISN